MIAASSARIEFLRPVRRAFTRHLTSVDSPFNNEGGLEFVAKGAFGAVFRGNAQGKPFAYKIMWPYNAKDPNFIAQFEHEAECLRILNSPYIAKLYEWGWYSGWNSNNAPLQIPFIRLQHCGARTIKRRVKKYGAVGWPVALRWGLKLCHALETMHAQGIVHRDIKPSNISLPLPQRVRVHEFSLSADSNERFAYEIAPQLYDFNNAFSASLREKFQRNGDAAPYSYGDPYFMSPEQIRGEAVDERGDLYSLALTLLYCVTGELPYSNGSGEILEKQLTADPLASLKESGGYGRVRESLVDLLTVALEKNPGNRYRSAREMRDALTPIMEIAWK